MNKKTLISFITISYNGFDDTCELIDSLQKNIKSVSFEIIVIDNASLKNEALCLQKKYPSITAIRSDKNLGFAGGNNLGIQSAKGNYLFFINNDTYFVDDKIINLISYMEEKPEIGGVSPKIKYAFPPFNIQYAGFTQLTSITIRNDTIGNGQAEQILFNQKNKTPYLHGAAMLIKKKVIKDVGLMPEVYFLYYEEIDWSTQITNKGYELWYIPELTVYHKESQSTGVKSQLRIYYMTRNRLLYAWRNRVGMNKYLSILYQIFIAAPKNLITFTVKKESHLNKALIKGIYSFFIILNKKDCTK